MANWKTSTLEQKDAVEGPPKVVPAQGKGFNPDADGTLTPGQWASNEGVEAHWLAGAAAGNKWDPHTRLKKDAFLEAVEEAKSHTFGHHHAPPMKAKG